MEQIVFATKNSGKIKEVKQILLDLPFEIVSMYDIGITVDVVEDGKTFEENAIKKASEISKVSGKITLADDSGLEIDFLDKKPGVYSARYLGENTPYIEKNNHILHLMKDVPEKQRTARFVCAIAAAFPNGKVLTAIDTIEGSIAHKIQGENGFGYDPIFFVPELGKTTAQLPPEQKNAISHRGKALQKMKQLLMQQEEMKQ
ncbi:XTP/dITP diphosphatase [Clostridium sp. MD294]|uniref:XTP/dITP diphosphatase n=1 Tax=Clostridium sp. MD294 TaxID=97138 RepID=UPI00039A5B7E|nr:XTP/dITP diphosphatase [Clostridium sp. MD294]NDO46663.1 XTP/dITP diphosphatase [Clostridium sp. MD294]